MLDARSKSPWESVDRTLERDWDGRRLAAWQHLVKHSLYGRPGRARALRR